MQKIERIVLTGGGTAGHVMPHLAMLNAYRSENIDILYVGSSGIEYELMTNAGVQFKVIRTGKFRRYISLKNVFDIGNIIWGVVQSFAILAKMRPNVVFSKGGFVSVPVCLAAWSLGIPVVSHESDFTPGLATRIISRFARLILCTFEDTCMLVGGKVKKRAVGTPIRPEILTGSLQAGLDWCHFSIQDQRPIVLIIGGTQGAQRINEAVHAALPELLHRYRIIHICGKGKLKSIQLSGYYSCEFAHKELADLYACAEMVVSRAGANTIFELLSMRKPMLLIPLEIGSRGDQIHNAEYFSNKGWSKTLRETELTALNLVKGLLTLDSDRNSITKCQASFSSKESADKIFSYLKDVAKG